MNTEILPVKTDRVSDNQDLIRTKEFRRRYGLDPIPFYCLEALERRDVSVARRGFLTVEQEIGDRVLPWEAAGLHELTRGDVLVVQRPDYRDQGKLAVFYRLNMQKNPLRQLIVYADTLPVPLALAGIGSAMLEQIKQIRYSNLKSPNEAGVTAVQNQMFILARGWIRTSAGDTGFA